MSDLLANLNPPQLAAVTLPPQHALILAGAGKTCVLTIRIAWLIATGQVGPQGILAVRDGPGLTTRSMRRLILATKMTAWRVWNQPQHAHVRIEQLLEAAAQNRPVFLGFGPAWKVRNQRAQYPHFDCCEFPQNASPRRDRHSVPSITLKSGDGLKVISNIPSANGRKNRS